MISEITLFAIEQAYAMDNMLDSFNDAMAAPDFVAGLIYGFTGSNHLTEIEQCYSGATDATSTVTDAIS